MTKTLIRSPKISFDFIQIYTEVWKYRSFLWNWSKRELEIRYKGSFLGIAWSFLNPILSLTIYFFVFSRITQTQIPNYLVFLFIGITFWNFSTQTLTRAPDILTSSAGILRKVYFPQEVLIISIVISGMINYLISFGLVLIIIFATKANLTIHFLWFPLVLLLQFVFLYSTSLLLSALGAIMRDLGQITATILGLLFFLTPIIYSAEAISKKFAWLLNSQPFATLLSFYRDIAYYGRAPNWHLLLYFCIFMVIWYLFCHWVFNRLRHLVSDLI